MTEERIDGEETKEKKKPKKSLKRELMEDVIMIVFVLVTVWVMKNYVLINAVIPSASMEDTIMTGDIAIFKFPDDESQLYIKRVIGLPGDKVQIIDGKVYINDSETPLDEPYLPEPPEGDYGPYYVPEDSYFMLGDNRNWSKDSRFWTNTYVKKEKVLAKAIFRYYPFNKIGVIEKD